MHTLTLTPHPRTDTVLAIGNFDGVHLGHQALLKQAKVVANKNGMALAVLTFFPHPREHFNPAASPLMMMPVRLKLELFRALGVDRVCLQPFNARFAATSARAFIHDLCIGAIGAKHIVTGDNFIFGHNREGTPELLAVEMQQSGRGYTRVTAIHCESGAPYSSTRIRALLAGGEIEQANNLLGHPYRITGRVLHGDKRGRKLGFPTANLAMRRFFSPAYGVYAARVEVDGNRYLAAVNIGIRPSFAATTPMLEAHVLDFSASLYGRRMMVQPLHFIRPEQKFADMQSLIDRIGRDVVEVREYFK